ncbi:cytochrome-c oxidase, cbb3-type subunit III [Tianweitania sediminis]|jgi:cytochrome c oxidase cbb3-type subunit 3|uniref:Cbb3-type cytochrome c oxidase subunit n=1 Tax=Tianweitania sediminis TaxID=1502156 RepID=A0A8J7QVH2_9HYPH|nr:cytochrome-c oxidase, cbb3-type subunit III [Tianweitania sediminis]MBP0437168.1 cytochrome-c oxidase, cbb3-type subunit III [Tianweitania sediminis]HEV7417246.1 cytochrome-c oxidase, cbb3-type subunit III [Tianweitania sediminis]
MSDIGADKGFPRVPGSEPYRGEVDQPTGTATTGHEWDGIKELNTPMPRWWLWVFYATHVFALAYIILYPSIPLLRDATTGLLGWNSRLEVAQELTAAETARAELYNQIRELPVEEIAKSDELREVAFRGGYSAFKVNCVQCHGADAAGSPGFANLQDDDWLWGGTLADIQYTIEHGVRFAGNEDTRYSEMPAFGRDGILERPDIRAVTRHVLSLSNSGPADPQGAEVYAANCSSCHGDAGEGNRELGAPRLNDAIWLYSSAPADIERQIYSPRHGAMPAWNQRLDPATIKQLTVYVHELGGGEASPEDAPSQ